MSDVTVKINYACASKVVKSVRVKIKDLSAWLDVLEAELDKAAINNNNTKKGE